MTQSTITFVLAFVAAVMIGMPCMAQDVEPPFTWEGKGVSSFISEVGRVEEFDFQFEMSIDEQGMVDGKTSSEDGTSKIKHVFYTERKQYDLPGFFARKIVIVLMVDENGDSTMLGILNGRILVDRFFYGEVMFTRYEEGSDTAKALGIGNPEATLMEGDELPYSLKSALEKCVPIGVVKIVGDYRSEEATAAAEATEPQDDGTLALFNGKDFEGWHIYLKDADADPKSVWKVQDGEILCSGDTTSFLRTKQEYSDFKLVLEWRWVEKPGNSGVLLHMGGEEKIWPQCIEAQLMHKRAGDLVGMGCNFNENKAKKGGPISYTPRMNDFSEKEPGGWNKYEIICKGDTIEVTVNGQLQNKATGLSVRKGYIGLQSEGVPIMFKNIYVKSLESAPKPTDDPRAGTDGRVQAVIDELEKSCIKREIRLLAPEKARRLVALLRQAKPRAVVECGTAVGYASLWIARELKAAGRGKLTTIEIVPSLAREAEANIQKAGLADYVTVRVGDARKLVKELRGPIDLVLLDCLPRNYHACFIGLEDKLADGAIVVADNAGYGARGMANYLKHVRARYKSTTEWFDIDLPWAKRDALEVTVVRRSEGTQK
jgi:predicted O-methyltransferase YrrM